MMLLVSEPLEELLDTLEVRGRLEPAAGGDEKMTVEAVNGGGLAAAEVSIPGAAICSLDLSAEESFVKT